MNKYKPKSKVKVNDLVRTPRYQYPPVSFRRNASQTEIVLKERFFFLEEEMVSLIQDLSTLNIEVDQVFHKLPSDAKFAYIGFTSAKNAEDFLNIVCETYSKNPNSLYQRARYANVNKDNWQYTTGVDDSNLGFFSNQKDEIVERTSKPNWKFQVAVIFPLTDLAEVKSLVQQSVSKTLVLSSKEVVN